MTQVILPAPSDISVASISKAISVMSPQANSVVVSGGSGAGVRYYRAGVNYDGGHAASKYGDFPTLDGGLSANASRNPV